MSGLDLSSLKKASQDQKLAVLIHPDGHKVHIAISALSPAMRKKLDDMPLHKSGEGEVPEQAVVGDPAAAVPQEEDSSDDDEPNYAAVPGAADAATLGATPHEPTDSTLPGAAPAAAPAAANPNITPDNVIHVIAPKVEQKMMDLKGLQQDYSNGHIEPKTAAQLFADQKLPAKIGTIFGLLLGGAGSGLTHQPNVVMGMINQQIENDFEAQKQNEANKRNWYTLSMEHDKNAALNAHTNAQTTGEELKNEYQRMTNQQGGIDTKEADVNGINRSTMGLLGLQQDVISRMAPGADRDKAQAGFDNFFAPALMGYAQNRIAKNEAQKALTAANTPKQEPFNPPPKGEATPGVRYSAYDPNKYTAYTRKGKFAPNAVDAIDPDKEDPVIREELGNFATNRNNYADYTGTVQSLADMRNAGQTPGTSLIAPLASGAAGAAGALFGPAGAATAATLTGLVARSGGESLRSWFERNRDVQKGELRTRLAHSVPADQLEATIDSMLPNWQDDDKAIQTVFQKGKNFFTGNEAETKAIKSRSKGLLTPAPNYQIHIHHEKDGGSKTPTPAAKPTSASVAGQE